MEMQQGRMFLSYHDSNGSEDSDVFQKSEMYCSMKTLKDDKKAVTGILRNYAILKWQGLHVQDHTLMSKKFNAQSFQVNQHLIRSICKTLARKFCLIVNFCIEELSTISFTGRCCLIVILLYVSAQNTIVQYMCLWDIDNVQRSGFFFL